ncbi:MAG TPA: DUF4347 domain-containing protein, partial [Hellea balneolensis]|nr:DUF4347 domain-containing protein [Hellea balneolensis]
MPNTKPSSEQSTIHNKDSLLCGTSRRTLGLLALEPRILLDAAAAVTGAEGLVDAMSQRHADHAVGDLFSPQALQAPGDSPHALALSLDQTARMDVFLGNLPEPGEEILSGDLKALPLSPISDPGHGPDVSGATKDITADKPPVSDPDVRIGKPVVYEPAAITHKPLYPESPSDIGPAKIDLDGIVGKPVVSKPVEPAPTRIVYEPLEAVKTDGLPEVLSHKDKPIVSRPAPHGFDPTVPERDAVEDHTLDNLSASALSFGDNPHISSDTPTRPSDLSGELTIEMSSDAIPFGENILSALSAAGLVYDGIVRPDLVPAAALLQPFSQADGDMPAARSLTALRAWQAGTDNADTAGDSHLVDDGHIVDGLDTPTAREGAVVVFVDTSVAGYQAILDSLPDGVEVVRIGAQEDGIAAMARYLQGRSGISAIHIISHGREGTLNIGASRLNTGSIEGQYADELAIIGQALSNSGDILIYGCDFGRNTQALDALAAVTQADIAASTNDTGSADLGGDWILESKTGVIEGKSIFAPNFDGLL